MTTKLALYNEALIVHLGERKLASISENREPRRVLDEIWDQGAVKSCLEQGEWKFALRTAQLTANPSVVPTFGYTKAFDKPTDFVKISRLCSDEFLSVPLTQYVEESAMWFTHLEDIYLSYVSNDASYGGDLTKWPESFVRYAAAYLAWSACGRILQSQTAKDDLAKTMKKLRTEALSKDALQGPTKFLPPGVWASSRGQSSARDRGSRGQLIG